MYSIFMPRNCAINCTNAGTRRIYKFIPYVKLIFLEYTAPSMRDGGAVLLMQTNLKITK